MLGSSMLRKSNFKILALIILGMVFTISFLSYKIYLEKKYDTSEYKLRYKKFCELYENKAELLVVWQIRTLLIQIIIWKL